MGSEVAILMSWVLTGKRVVAAGNTVTVGHDSQIHGNTFSDKFRFRVELDKAALLNTHVDIKDTDIGYPAGHY